MVPSKFGVNWPFSSGEAKNRFSRWRPWRPSWISDRNDFSYFWSTSHPNASYQVSSQLAQGCRRSRLWKQLLTPHDGRRTTDDGHWLTTIAHHEHFVLRWAKKKKKKKKKNDFGFRGDNYITKKVSIVSLTQDMPTYWSSFHPYQILSKYLKQYGSYGLHKISDSGEITIKRRHWELSFLHATHPLVLLFISIKHYQNMSKGIKVKACTSISAKGEITTQQIKLELSLLHATCLLVLLFIPTKYYQIISNSMGVMTCTRFGFRGDNYIRKSESCLLHLTYLQVLLFIPTKHYQNMSKSIKFMERTRMSIISASGEITT